VRPNNAKKRLWLCVSTAALAAVAATGAFGVSGSDTITTIAGNGVQGFSGDGGPATSAKLDTPDGVAVDGQGNIYIADLRNSRVRKVSVDGTIATFAGTGQPGFSGDGGLATSARLYAPEGVAVDGQGNVYIADRNNYRVRKVSPGGTITTFAGGGKPGSLGDGGLATSATLRSPSGVAVDGQGNLYIADRDNSRVRKVNRSGTITTFAGTDKERFSGDGGPATSALLYRPDGVAVDGRGNIYIADTFNNRVRKVSPGGTITTFAGTGACSSLQPGDGGPATSANVCNPRGVAVDGQGNVYIADTNSSRVRKVSPGGTITTFAGTGSCGPVVGNGGPPNQAQLCGPSGMAVDGQGNLYIAEESRSRVRKVSVGAQAAAPKLTLGGASTQRLLAQKGITVTARWIKPCSLSATGSVTILGTRYVFVLTRATAKLAVGTRTLTLRFPAAEQKRFRRLLKPGQRARATITVKATDKAGNTSTSKRTVVVQG
jgi:sugar lactone lactonase YvrE